MTKAKLILKKYTDMPMAAKAAIWFAVCNFTRKGLDALTIPIFTRLLTTDQYGLYTVYRSWYTVISIFATLNLSAGVFNNGMIKFKNERDKFTSAVQGLSMTVTTALLIVYLCAHDYFNALLGLPTLLVITLFIELLFTPAYMFWAARQRFDYKYRALVAVTILIAVASPMLGVIAVLLSEHKAEARVLSYAAVQICIGLILFFVNMYKGKKFCVKDMWKYALWFNIPLIPHFLSMSVLGQSDRIMIDRLVGRSDAAFYGLAYNLSQIMVLLTSAISNSFVPYTYKAVERGKFCDVEKNSNALLLLVSFLTMLTICFGPEIIRIFASPDYYEARWIMPPVALSMYFIFLYDLFGNIEFFYEARKFVMFASMIAAVVNIALNYVFINMYGYIAAGYTTLVCYILLSFAHYAFHRKVLGKYANGVKIYNAKLILAISLLLIIFGIIMLFVYDYIIIRYAVVLALCVIVFLKRNYFIDKIKNIRS